MKNGKKKNSRIVKKKENRKQGGKNSKTDI